MRFDTYSEDDRNEFSGLLCSSFGPIPWFAWEPIEAAMRVDDKIRKTVVFVGHVPDSGHFIPYGTGFIAVSFIDDNGFQQIVTARHVIDKIPGDVISVRVNAHGGTAQILKGVRSDWIPHPNRQVDVSICPSVIAKDQFDIMHLDIAANVAMENEEAKEGHPAFGTGDDVIIPGMFVGRIGEGKNIPIVRSGIIAAMPEEPLETTYGRTDAYLIESLSIDGLSGSPVFAASSVLSLRDSKIEPQERIFVRLIGMNLGRNQVYDSSEVIEIVQRHASRPPETLLATVPLNTGISIVLPLKYILEAIEQPAIQEKRQQTIKTKSANSRFHPD